MSPQSVFFNLIERDDIIVVEFAVTHLNDEENIDLMGQELFSLVDNDGWRKVVVDMRIVEFVTSSVLGKLITLHRRLHRHDGKMVIYNLWGEVESVMETSKLDMYFNLATDVESAVVMLND